MISSIGYINFAYGLVTIPLTLLLLIGSKKKNIALCATWSWAKIVFILVLITGFGVTILLPPLESDLDASYSVTSTSAVFTLIAMCAITFDIYFIYVVSIYITVLKLVDRKYDLLAKRIRDLSISVVKSPYEEEPIYDTTTEVVKKKKEPKTRSFPLQPATPLTSTLFRDELVNVNDDAPPKPRRRHSSAKVEENYVRRKVEGPANFVALFDRQEMKNEALNKNLPPVEQSSTLFGSEKEVPKKKKRASKDVPVTASEFRQELTPVTKTTPVAQAPATNENKTVAQTPPPRPHVDKAAVATSKPVQPPASSSKPETTPTPPPPKKVEKPPPEKSTSENKRPDDKSQPHKSETSTKPDSKHKDVSKEESSTKTSKRRHSTSSSTSSDDDDKKKKGKHKDDKKSSNRRKSRHSVVDKHRKSTHKVKNKKSHDHDKGGKKKRGKKDSDDDQSPPSRRKSKSNRKSKSR